MNFTCDMNGLRLGDLMEVKTRRGGMEGGGGLQVAGKYSNIYHLF